MNIHEFQAKCILGKYGIPIPEFGVISNLEDTKKLIKKMNLNQAVLKVQVHAGGRGKAGGVKFANNPDEILQAAEKLIGLKIINNQTGPRGQIAEKVIVSPPVDIKKEYYVGVVIDRAHARASLVVSPEGGQDIEEIAAKHPEKILTIPLGLCKDKPLRAYHLAEIMKFMGWKDELAKQGKVIILGICKAFAETDASLLEINPLVESKEGILLALDVKLNIDDNALYRQKEIAEFFDPSQMPPHEVEAKKHDLAYISLDGNIGCMVNGAGLAMATMDIIKYAGGTPANFLDVGGGASQEKVAEGFKLILSDPNVKAVLINIFGGIMNCVTLAGGIVAAAGELEIKVPLIVRMEGTNVEKGKKMLQDSGLNIIIADTLSDAAEKVVKAARG